MWEISLFAQECTTAHFFLMLMLLISVVYLLFRLIIISLVIMFLDSEHWTVFIQSDDIFDVICDLAQCSIHYCFHSLFLIILYCVNLFLSLFNLIPHSFLQLSQRISRALLLDSSYQRWFGFVMRYLLLLLLFNRGLLPRKIGRLIVILPTTGSS